MPFRPAKKISSLQAQLLDAIEQSVIGTDLGGIVIYWNRFAEQLYGWSAEEAIGRNIMHLTPPKASTQQADDEIMTQLRQGKSWTGEFIVQRKDGTTFPAQITNSPIYDKQTLIGVIGLSNDITERKRMKMLIEAQKQSLEMVVKGAPLLEILCYLTQVVEQQTEGQTTASLLLLDEQGYLHNGASPNLSEDFIRAIDGVKADVNGRTCSEAAASGNIVITPDIAAEPKWQGLAHLPLEQGFKAVWTMPIIARDGHVLGTFGTYFRERREPTAIERQVVEILGRTAALAIEGKQTEDVLRNSENELRLVTDAVPLLVSYVDREHRYRFVNRGYTEWFGRSREEVIGKHISEVIGQVAYQAILPEVEKVLSGEEVFFERLVPFKGGERFTHLNYIPEVDATTGQVTGFHAFVQDITKRKQAEEELRRQRDFTSAITTNIGDGICACDQRGLLTFINPAAENILGWKESELVGKNMHETIHFQKADGTRVSKQDCPIQQVLKSGKKVHIEDDVFTLRDDSIIPIAYTSSPIITNGQITGTVVTFQNITERKRAEEAFHESEERLRMLIESVTDYAIFTINTDKQVDSWNIGAEKVFGYKEQEILGKSGAILFTPEDRERGVPEQEIQTALEKGRADDERWHIRKDNSRFYASGMMMPLKDGGAGGLVKIARDMTDKIKIEKAQRDKEILQKLIGAQEDERKHITHELHDQLGQQMTVLRLKLDVLKKMCDNNEELGEQVDEIQKVARQLDSDVDFLAWKMRPTVLDDIGIVAALDQYIRQWSAHFNIPTEFDAKRFNKTRLKPEVETNFYRITQEALNNIYKHAKASKVNVLLEPRDGSVVLIIEDNGIGFESDTQISVEKGMGLLGMNERAALIGGKFEIESTESTGTTVYVSVPV